MAARAGGRLCRRNVSLLGEFVRLVVDKGPSSGQICGHNISRWPARPLRAVKGGADPPFPLSAAAQPRQQTIHGPVTERPDKMLPDTAGCPARSAMVRDTRKMRVPGPDN